MTAKLSILIPAYNRPEHLDALLFSLVSQKNKDLEIRDYCDYIFHVPSLNTAFIQEMHTILGHEVCLSVEKKIHIPS